jgi:hypothetical protein
MKNLTAKQVLQLSNSIFFRLDFKGEWRLLTDNNGNTFEFISEAKAFVRENFCRYVELSTLEQALIGNGQWDNV